MDVVYKVKCANDARSFSTIRRSKIIFESTNQDKLKGRYSIVVLEDYGSVTLDNNQLIINTREK